MVVLRVYCDTNIFLDIIGNRRDPLRPLGDLAFDFLSRGWNCLFKIVVSDLVIEEIEKYANKKDLFLLLERFKDKNKLIRVGYQASEVKKAKALSKNWTDALHFIIAERERCDYLVTRNVNDFSTFQGNVDIVYPENV